MRITKRDVTVLKDLALSHALTRDQFMKLGHFSSITRTNTCLRRLVSAKLVARLQTPFWGQSIYTVTKCATDLVGPRIASLIKGRSVSPRFLQHALTVTEARIVLCEQLGGPWRFEPQLWRKLDRLQHEIRPDGLVLSTVPVFVEIDLGHVAPTKFREKLLGYQALATSGDCEALYGFPTFRLLTLTTGTLRAHRLSRLTPLDAGYEHCVQTLASLGVTLTNDWS
ncbi:MAG: replication-relaxation family protein [Fimbriimonadaceae bacterium]|nr:replication-relaxation family protein [Fimbriimonadaceae bacterium]QYK58065.1 MAG: replication-relaxation family protein [Fimbriimonadaceae bacterium]